MPAQILLNSIVIAAIVLAGNSFPAFAAGNEKELQRCGQMLIPFSVSVVGDEPLLTPARVRIMPMGSQPSYMFVTGGNQRLIAWADDRDAKLNVSFLESPSDTVISVPLYSGEVVRGYDGDGNPDHIRVETDRRILTLEFKR